MAFDLPRVPRRIEIYDNSHIQGTNAVGAMVVAGSEGFRKNQYRKFNIRSADLVPGDDFGMMREVLTRRFKRLMNESPRNGSSTPAVMAATCARPGQEGFRETTDGDGSDAMPLSSLEVGPMPSPAPPADHADDDTESPWPDLVLIDGGLGQLNAAREILASLNVDDVPLVAIAKGPDRDAGRETFFMPGREPFRLKPRDPVLYFVERLRDEAHRFAIGSHRQKRKRDIREAGLQEIPGVGPARKRALLRHFGTLTAIERAAISDLERVPGINSETARKIYDFFHGAPG